MSNMQQYPVLTSQFSAFRSALPLLQNTTDVVVPQPVAFEDFIHVDAIVFRGVFFIPADPGSSSQGHGYQEHEEKRYGLLHDVNVQNTMIFPAENLVFIPSKYIIT